MTLRPCVPATPVRSSGVPGRSGLAALALAALAWQPLAAGAATCNVLTATGAAFGNYDTTQNDLGIVTISGSCSRAGAGDPDMTGSEVSLSFGLSLSYAPRKMSDGGANRLNYNLYTDVARTTTVWGDGTGGTGTVTALPVQGNGRFLNPNATRTFSLTAYGRIPAGQSVASGSYSDMITVTITF